MAAYYNEIDPYAAQWLRNLISAGHIAPGDVDERSIVDVRADDLKPYTQCHFFAGIGGWSLALRLAGWPDDRPIWTGSCPCQPFSAAGKGKAADDERHLWPRWFPLIAERRPAIVFGEQVEAAVGWGWLDLVFADLESEGYACGAAVLPACSVGAPHIRQRLWWVADSTIERCGEERSIDGWRPAGDRTQGLATGLELSGGTRKLGDAYRSRSPAGWPTAAPVGYGRSSLANGSAGELGNAERRGFGKRADQTTDQLEAHDAGQPSASASSHGELGDANTSRLPPRERTIIPGQRGGA